MLMRAFGQHGDYLTINLKSGGQSYFKVILVTMISIVYTQWVLPVEYSRKVFGVQAEDREPQFKCVLTNSTSCH